MWEVRGWRLEEVEQMGLEASPRTAGAWKRLVCSQQPSLSVFERQQLQRGWLIRANFEEMVFFSFISWCLEKLTKGERVFFDRSNFAESSKCKSKQVVGHTYMAIECNIQKVKSSVAITRSQLEWSEVISTTTKSSQHWRGISFIHWNENGVFVVFNMF